MSFTLWSKRERHALHVTIILHRAEGTCKAVWKREFKLPWREAGPPYHHDGKMDSDQQVVCEELSLAFLLHDAHHALVKTRRPVKRHWSKVKRCNVSGQIWRPEVAKRAGGVREGSMQCQRGDFTENSNVAPVSCLPETLMVWGVNSCLIRGFPGTKLTCLPRAHNLPVLPDAVPPSSEYGTHTPIKAQFRPCRAG